MSPLFSLSMSQTRNILRESGLSAFLEISLCGSPNSSSHLGNDVCVVVFLDPGDEHSNDHFLFNPFAISSHFIHVFLVVSLNWEKIAET
jgi:hypothetical protein